MIWRYIFPLAPINRVTKVTLMVFDIYFSSSARTAFQKERTCQTKYPVAEHLRLSLLGRPSIGSLTPHQLQYFAKSFEGRESGVKPHKVSPVSDFIAITGYMSLEKSPKRSTLLQPNIFNWVSSNSRARNSLRTRSFTKTQGSQYECLKGSE